MANLLSKSIYQRILRKTLVLGALALGASASTLRAQETLAGKFTLIENTRFGNTVLGAGKYNFLIEPIGVIQSMRSIEEGAGHLVLVVVRAEKSGPGASFLAMASPSHAREKSELVIEPQKAEALAQTMYLEKEGLVVDFNWLSPKAKEQVIAQEAVPAQPGVAAAGSKVEGTN